MDSEYIISGGREPTAHFNVDDWLRVYLEDELVAEGAICLEAEPRTCPASAPIRFRGDTGNTLRIEAEDANNCYSLDALWLQKGDGSCLTQLNDEILGPNCGSEPANQLFFQQTYTLP